MAATVLPLQPVKLPTGPSPLTPEQSYWYSFKSQVITAAPSNSPITHISQPSTDPKASAPAPDLFAVTAGTRVQLFSNRTRKLQKTIARFDDIAHGADIRRDGRVLVAGDESGTIQVFDVNTRAILRTWKDHKQPVWRTQFSPFDPTKLLSACDDRTVRLWDLPSPTSEVTFSGHHDYVRCGAFMTGHASSLVVSGSYDQTVRVWDSRTPATAVMTFKHSAPIESVLPMPSGTMILAAADNQVSILDLVAAKPLQILRNHQKTVTSLCLASNNQRLVSGGLDGHLKVFETNAWNAGSRREDRHLAVGMQSGQLSIKSRLSGENKAKEKARRREMEALVRGDEAKLKRLDAKKKTQGYLKRHRGEKFSGEGVDVIIEGRPKHDSKLKVWERLLRQGKYSAALDEVLQQKNLSDILTLFMALRHRSATRSALSGRNEISLQPIYTWICKHVTDPRHVSLCTDLGMTLLEIYSEHQGESAEIDRLTRELHKKVRVEVERSQQARQTQGMLSMLMCANE